MHESTFGSKIFKILSESVKIHNYNDASVALILECESTTCFSKEWSLSLSYAKLEKPKLKFPCLSYEGLFITNEVTVYLPYDSWVPSWLLNLPTTFGLPSEYSHSMCDIWAST